MGSERRVHARDRWLVTSRLTTDAAVGFEVPELGDLWDSRGDRRRRHDCRREVDRPAVSLCVDRDFDDLGRELLRVGDGEDSVLVPSNEDVDHPLGRRTEEIVSNRRATGCSARSQVEAP